MSQHFFIPDITAHLNGRNKVCEILLHLCKSRAGKRSRAISLETNIFKELPFSVAEVISIIADTGKILMVNFSWSLILQPNQNFTLQDMGEQLWRYMSKAVKYN